MKCPVLILITLLVFGQFTPALADSTTLDLAWCETRATQTSEFRAAGAEAAANDALADESEAMAGWKVFGGGTLGTAREPVDEDSKRSYEYFNLRLGLRYPLLGSYQKEQEIVAERRLQSHLADLKEEEDDLQQLKDIRLSYINLWADRSIQAWTDNFLEAEGLLGELLALRRDKGLLLEGDRREFMTMYALAHRNQARYRWQAETALAQLEALTGSRLEQAAVSYPSLPIPADATRVRGQIANHPSVMRAAYLVNEEQVRHHTYSTYHIDSGVNISQGWTSEFPGGNGFDTAVSIDFRMPWEFLKAGRARARYHHFAVRQQEATLREANQTLGKQAQEEWTKIEALRNGLDYTEERLLAVEETLRERFLRAALLEGDSLESLQQGVFAYYQVGVDFYEAQRDLLQAQAELLALAPPGETATTTSRPEVSPPKARLLGRELLTELRQAADRVALDAAAERLFGSYEEIATAAPVPVTPAPNVEIEIQVQPAAALNLATVANAGPSPAIQPAIVKTAEAPPVAAALPKFPAAPPQSTTEKPDPAPGSEHPAAPHKDLPEAGLGAYLWNGSLLLQAVRERTDPNAWAKEFRAAQPFTSVLISFNGREIDSISRDLPLRLSLSALLRALQQNGIRTDLLLGEPNWILDRYRGDLPYLLPKLTDLPFQGLHLDLEPEQLKATGLGEEKLLNGLLETLRRVKEVTSLPLSISLNYRDPLRKVNGRTLIDQLAELGLQRLVLMIYVSNPERAAEIAAPILRACPKLQIGIAQSVEPSPLLNAEESYYRFNRNELRQKLADLTGCLAGYNNFDLILIQNYTYFQRLAP